jgi:hypothetical protein
MMPRNDEELKGWNVRNKGGAHRREGASGDESMLQYLRSILLVVDKDNFKNLKGYL